MGWCRSRVAVVGLAFVVVFALAACSDDTDPSTTPLTTDAGGDTTTTTDRSATSTTATTTFAQADEPPELVNTGEDFDAIVRSFLAFGEWLSVHPQPELLSQMYREGGPAWSSFHDVLVELSGNGRRTDGAAPATVTETRVLERPDPDLALIYLVIDNPAYDVLDREGNVVEHAEADPLTSWAYELRRQADGRWLVEDRTVLGSVEE